MTPNGGERRAKFMAGVGDESTQAFLGSVPDGEGGFDLAEHAVEGRSKATHFGLVRVEGDPPRQVTAGDVLCCAFDGGQGAESDPDQYGNLSSISVQATSADTVDDAQAQIESILDARHHTTADDRDFNVSNSASLLDAASSITGIFTILLGAIAGISLLLGGIGVMNIMLVTVTERTREIGIRKAIGAGKYDIISQFLLEAVLLSVLGGVAGIPWATSSARSRSPASKRSSPAGRGDRRSRLRRLTAAAAEEQTQVRWGQVRGFRIHQSLPRGGTPQ